MSDSGKHTSATPHGHAPRAAMTAAPVAEEAKAGRIGWTALKEHVRAKPNINRIVWARVLAEVGAVVGASAVAGVVSGTMLHRPWDAIRKKLSKNVVEPNLDAIDGFLESAKSFDPPDERAERHQKPRDEQAKEITNFFADNYGLKAGAAIVGQYYAQDFLTRAFKVNGVTHKANMLSVAGDRAVGVGSVILLNTLLSDQSIQVQNTLENVLKKAGMSEQEAEGWASYAVNLQIPNLTGLAASVGILAAFARK
jgi:hypothetical protein